MVVVTDPLVINPLTPLDSWVCSTQSCLGNSNISRLKQPVVLLKFSPPRHWQGVSQHTLFHTHSPHCRLSDRYSCSWLGSTWLFHWVRGELCNTCNTCCSLTQFPWKGYCICSKRKFPDTWSNDSTTSLQLWTGSNQSGECSFHTMPTDISPITTLKMWVYFTH